MALYLIGLGLFDAKDISLRGLEAVRKADIVYFEAYTSKLGCSIEDLERLYNKKMIISNRELIENDQKKIINRAKEKNVAVLVIGDPLCATTHISLMLSAKESKIKTVVIPNASIMSAIGVTGLEVYKFGKATSIPFENKNVKTPYEVFVRNYKNGLHTLFLLDLNPEKERYMTAGEAVKYLIGNGLSEDILCVGCAAVGSGEPEIKVAKAKDLINHKFSKFPQCLVIPAKKLHFVEEDALKVWM